MAKTNMMTVLWLDPLEQLSAETISVFRAQNLAVIQPAAAADDEIISADVVVVNLCRDIDLLKQVQARQAALSAAAPIVARVSRDMFELGIDAMSQGAVTVVSSDQISADKWVETFAEAQISPSKDQPTFVFADPVSRNLLALTERVAQVDVTVLLTGPTGAGKEVLARILHDASPRYEGPFVAFNCAAMPENLIEDMLFGHEKGSFTGASKVQPGLFEQAQGGTIFLDEIGEMSFHLQAKLLRILQERSVVRLGGQKGIDLDIRVIAATNRNLKNAIAQRSFREDLYFRLSAFKLTIPPLRERPLDILPLIEQFINQQTTEGQSVRLTTEAQELLVTYQWPGNVRELQNVIIRAMVLCHQGPIDSQHLIFDDMPIAQDFERQQGMAQTNDHSTDLPQTGGVTQTYFHDAPQMHDQPLNQAVKNSECQSIMAALRASRSRDQAAERLGISPRTLRHKLQKLREQGISVTRAYAR
ncbi:MAG: sigma-54 dependent transcriptional regulator [Porticoccaceae bacterium]|nr:sigma-54 dependent transcriptional regulator [Porticoccaceae bacterium]